MYSKVCLGLPIHLNHPASRSMRSSTKYTESANQVQNKNTSNDQSNQRESGGTQNWNCIWISEEEEGDNDTFGILLVGSDCRKTLRFYNLDLPQNRISHGTKSVTHPRTIYTFLAWLQLNRTDRMVVLQSHNKRREKA